MNRFFTLLLAASCLTAVGQVPDYVPADGLVGWWPMNGGGQNAFSESHQGQLDGPVAGTDRFGQLDGALFFDGTNDGMFVPHDEVFSASEQTIALWMWVESPEFADTPGLSNGMGVVNKTLQGTSNNQNRHFDLSLGSSEEPSPEPFYLTLASSNGQLNNVESTTTSRLFFSQEWFFVVAVLTEDNLVIFVDGIEEASSSLVHPRIPNTAQIKLGVDYTFNENRYFHGLLDDFAVWNRALSDAEVLELYLASAPEEGCTNESACNFDLEAVVDDGSCTLADCTDPQACNFNSEAACDDGNCIYAPTIDLGEDIVSCEEWVVLEAQDGQFFHWSTGESDSIIEVSQTGFYAVEASSQIGEPNVISGHTFIGRLGQSDYYISEASISWEDARMQSESLGGHLAVITSPEENELVWQGVYGNGLNPGGTNNYQAWIGLYQDFESPDYAEPNGGWRWVTDEAVSYLNWAANRPGNLDQGYFVHMTDANGNCPEGDIVCGTWDDSGISANLQSAFYVLEVESPYGSCTSSDSIFVEFDHGSCFCGPGTIWDAEMHMCIGDGSGDINLDGCVQLNDLLDLLSAYGNCGAEESPWQCGDPLEYQSYEYETVQIVEQCWFAENLRAQNYRNGEAIPTDLSNFEWAGTAEGAVSLYGGDIANLSTYGRLYNWYAVDDPRDLCPGGWHVPSDGEWMTMEVALGMSEIDANSTDFRGTDQGTQMKTTFGWASSGEGTNSSGFSGLPGGYLFAGGGVFNFAGTNGWWWSSSPSDEYAWSRVLLDQSEQVARFVYESNYGFSVRCIRDAE